MKPQNSKNTSINNRLPALYKRLDNLYMCGQLAINDIDTIVDYGCGRYPDHVKQWCADRDKVLFQYDTYWEIDRYKHFSGEYWGFIRNGLLIDERLM